jgi:hypothetical protein
MGSTAPWVLSCELEEAEEEMGSTSTVRASRCRARLGASWTYVVPRRLDRRGSSLPPGSQAVGNLGLTRFSTVVPCIGSYKENLGLILSF